MESNSEASCMSDPNFAVICAFLERFASSCGIRYPSFVDLQDMLENSEEVPQELIELHIMLLRKARRSVFKEKWEKALVKFCHTYSTQDGWEIERFGYKNSRLEVKLRALKSLLEGQFDYNCKFKSNINTLESTQLRSKPLGKDKLGRIYWLQFDPTSNVRVYREDLDEESWTLVAKDRDSLVQLLQELSADEESLNVNLLNEDSSVSAEIEKPITDTGQENHVSVNGDSLTNGETIKEEKDPLEIKEVDDVKSEVKHEELNKTESQDSNVDHEKRKSIDDMEDEREMKKSKLNDTENKMSNGTEVNNEEVEVKKEEDSNKDDTENDGLAATTTDGVKDSDVSCNELEKVKLEEVENNVSEKDVNPENIEEESKSKENDVELGEAIEDPVIHVYGEGSGAECNAGNPDKEESKNEEGSSSNSAEQTELISSAQTNAEVKKSDAEIKPQPKLWSIDTICGTSNLNHSGESSKSEKSNQKFSSFSIESVLEKKTDVSQSSSPASEAPQISVNSVSVNNIQMKDLNEISDGTSDDADVKKCETQQCSANSDSNSGFHDGEKIKETTKNEVNTNEPVPIPEKDIQDDGSTTACAEEKSDAVIQDEIRSKIPEQNTHFIEETEDVKGNSVTNNENVMDSVLSEKKDVETEETKSTRLDNDFKTIKPPSDNTTTELSSDTPKPLSISETQSSGDENQSSTTITAVGDEKHTDANVEREEYVKMESSEDKSLAIVETNKQSEECSQPNNTKNSLIEVERTEIVEQPAIVMESDALTENSTMDEKKVEITEVASKDSSFVEAKPMPIKEPESEIETVITNSENSDVGVKDTADSELAEKTFDIEMKEVPDENPVPAPVEEHTEKVLEPSSDDINKLEEIQKEAVRETDSLKVEGPIENLSMGEHSESVETQNEKEENQEEPMEVETDLKIPEETSEVKCDEVEVNNDTCADEEKKAEELEVPETPKEKPQRSRKRRSEPQPEIQRTTRARKQSLEEETLSLPTRSRTRKKSAEIIETPKAIKRESKRKSRGSTEANETPVNEPAPDSPSPNEEKLTEEKQDTEANSVPDESSAVKQDDNAEIPVQKPAKKRKKKGRKRFFTRGRRSTEHKRNIRGNNSDEEKKIGKVEGGESSEKKKEEKAKKKESKARKLIPDREMNNLGIDNTEELPIRQSRRIALLKLKEEAERSKLKELEAEREEGSAKKKKKKKKSKTGKKGKDDESYEEEDEDDEEVKKQEKEKKKRKKKDKLKFNELNPWISSSGSSSADEEEDDIEDEAHDEEELVFKSDHEFSPESDIEDPDYKPIKRARTAKVDSKDATPEDSKYDDTACEKCSKKDHPEWILLCDKCDKGWHASCVRPALMVVPEGDWFCPPCEHTSLVQKLRESLVEYDRCQKQRENEELRRKRLAFVGISLDNVLPSKKDKKRKPSVENGGESEETGSDNSEEGSSSGSGSDSGSDSSESESSSSDESSEPVYQLRERRTNITSYRYNEYDELIKSALQEEMEAVKGVGLGKGKNIANQAQQPCDEDENEEEEEEDEEGAETNQEAYTAESVPVETSGENPEDHTVINPEIPSDIGEAKPKIRQKKKENEDGDYLAETEDEEEYNAAVEEEIENEGEEEELADEVPPVVPRYDKKKKKSRSLNVRGLDFTSDEEEEDNSDSDFKGESSEEESDYSLPSESESSDGGVRKKNKNFDGPLRRSTRARTSRYDKEFINDDSDDDAPRKKKRNIWVESESSDSDRSWGRRKKRSNRSSRASVPKRRSKAKPKRKKVKKRGADSDEDVPAPKKPRNRKIKFGGLDTLEEEEPIAPRRTRGKKINYQEMNASDSDDEVIKRRSRMIGDSDEEFVADRDKSDDSDEAGVSKKDRQMISKLAIMRIIKKKRKLIPYTEEETEELKEIEVELEDLDEEEEEILDKLLKDGEVPLKRLKETLKTLKEKRSDRLAKPYPPIPEHMQNPGVTGPRFPRIGRIKITPSRAELAAMGVQSDALRANPGMLLGAKDNLPEDILLSEQKKEGMLGMQQQQPPPYPYPPDAAPSMMNFPLNNRPPVSFNNFQGVITPQRLPPEYPNIPTNVLGIDKGKRKDGLSDEEGDDNSGDPDSPSRRQIHNRGKKDGKDLGISTVQAPTQFPPQGIPEGGSVITRMLNAPQPFTEFPMQQRVRSPFRPPFANASTLRPPLNPPSPRLRAPAPGFMHASHPVDPNKAIPPGFPPRAATLPRYPADPNVRPPFSSQSPPPPRNDFPYPNMYGPYPMSNSGDAPFPSFPNHPFDEQVSQMEGGTSAPGGVPIAGKPPFEEEAGGEFGGLASYFASQREDDLDT